MIPHDSPQMAASGWSGYKTLFLLFLGFEESLPRQGVLFNEVSVEDHGALFQERADQLPAFREGREAPKALNHESNTKIPANGRPTSEYPFHSPYTPRADGLSPQYPRRWAPGYIFCGEGPNICFQLDIGCKEHCRIFHRHSWTCQGQTRTGVSLG